LEVYKERYRNHSHLRRKAVIPQEAGEFRGTIKENRDAPLKGWFWRR